MKRANGLALWFVLIAGGVFAQNEFQYKRDVTGAEREGWYRITLPQEIFRHLNEQFGDIRLNTVQSNDTTEVPYLLQVMAEEVTVKEVDLPLFNESYRGDDLYLMINMPSGRKANHLDLSSDQRDYFAFVTVEGSDNRKDWFTLADDLRLLSVSRPGEDYRLSTVSFPVSDYRFLRLRVKSDKRLSLRDATFAYRELKPGIHHPIPLTWKSATDDKARETRSDIILNDYAPVNTLGIAVQDTGNYYRSFRIEAVTDSFKTDKGWRKLYRTLHQGYLTSYSPNEFRFVTEVTGELRVVVENRDNAPLLLSTIEAFGPEVRLTARLASAPAFVLYGRGDMRSPVYDLAHFNNKIPTDLMNAALGPEEKLFPNAPQAGPLFERRAWLWGVIVLAIGLLGYFTVRMMRDEKVGRS